MPVETTEELRQLIDITREQAALEQERVTELRSLREEMARWREVAQRQEWMMYAIKGLASDVNTLVSLIGLVLGQDRETLSKVQSIIEDQAAAKSQTLDSGLTIEAGGDVKIGGNVEDKSRE